MAEVEVFKIDIQPVVSELAKLGSELEKARAKYQETKNSQTEYSEDAIRAKAEVNVLSKEFNALTNVLTNQQKGLGELKKATEANIDITKIQNNTIETNRKLYNALYNQQLRNPSEQVAKQVKALSDELKKQESALGNNTRKVGDYAGGFSDAIKELKLFGVSTDDIAKGLENAKTGFAAAGGGVKGFSAALATTGLPLIIMAVQKLLDIFSEYTPILEAVEDAVASVGAAWTAFVSGGSVKDAIADAKNYLAVQRDIEDTAKSFEIVQQKAENQIAKLIVQSKDRTKTEQERLKLVKEANEIEKEIFKEQEKRLLDSVNSQAKDLSNKLGISTQKLKLLATETSEESKALRSQLVSSGKLTEAKKKELELFQSNFLSLSKIQGSYLTLQEKNTNREASLLQEIQAERDKESEKQKEAREKKDAAEAARLEKLKQELEKRKAAEEKYAADLLKIEDTLYQTEREKATAALEAQFNAIVGNSAKEIALREELNKKIIAADEKFVKEQAEKKKQARISVLAKEFNDKIAFNQKQLDLDLGAVDLSVGTEKEKERRKAKIQLAALEEQLRLTKEFLGPEGSLTKEQLQGLAAIEQAIAKAKKGLKPKEGEPTVAKSLGIDPENIKKGIKALEQISQGLQAVTDIVNMGFETRLNNIDATKNAEIDAINQSTVSEEEKAIRIQKAERDAANAKYQIQLKQFQANKATSIIQTIINTAQAVMAQLLAPPPAGFIFAGLAAAAGAAQIALIASQKPPPPPKFATGVIGLEGAGTATSDSIDAKLSRGESVMTAKATERFAPILAQMELAVGNRPNFQMGNKKFATGFIPIGDGGYSTRNAASDLMAANASEKAMMQAVAAMPAQKLVLEEFRNFETNVDKSVAISEL
jgi:hypothetical protein